MKGVRMRVNKNRAKSKKAFTLAEVLITLAIIGVVAALTVPTVIRNYQERQTISALKKAYAQLSQAFNMATIENGAISTWSLENCDTVLDIMQPYLKITKKCAKGSGCISDSYKALNGKDTTALNSHCRGRLADGTSFTIYTHDGIKNCETNNYCGEIGIDLNGNKAPNQIGKDFFLFFITKNGVRPMGAPDTVSRQLATNCKMSNQDIYTGYACTAWVIAKSNMDYLRRDVSW